MSLTGRTIAAPFIGMADAARAITLLVAPDGWHEVTTIPSRRASCGWFHGGDHAGILAHAARLDGKEWEKGVYLTLNPCAAAKDGQAKDEDVIRRRWLFLDFDAHGEKGQNASREEKDGAGDTMERCREWLTRDRGWPEPVVIDSGNGYYLLFRLDVEADAVSRAIVHRATQAIGAAYGVAVDAKVTNAGRICRLPGTLNRRGPDTPERPQRRCRIVSAPEGDRPLVLPWEAVVNLAGPEPVRTKPAPKPASRNGNGKGYGEKAFDEELSRLNSATEGNRNDQLNKSAFALFQLAAGGVLDAGRVEGALRDAASGVGLEAGEIEATLKSARTAGEKEPRGVPEKTPAAPAKPKTPKDVPLIDRTLPPGERIVYPASEVKPRKVEWLWPHRIPRGKLTTFAGMGGLGKTFVLLDMTARITTGKEWPDREPGAAPGKVLFISGEDDPDDTLVPRLIELGADLSKVYFLTDAAMGKFLLAHVELIKDGLAQAGEGVSLIVIDPPTSYLGGADDHKNSELRGILTPLKEMAQTLKVAIVFNTHVNKGGSNVEAMARVIGGVAWVNAVRAAHLFAKDPDDGERRVFVPMKSNLGKPRKGLAYRIEPSGDIARVEWLGEVDTTADQAAGAQKAPTRKESAAAWLVERFAEKNEWASDDLFKAAKAAGISRDAMFEAKDKLDLPKARKVSTEAGHVEWQWWVPPGWTPPGQPSGRPRPGEKAI